MTAADAAVTDTPARAARARAPAAEKFQSGRPARYEYGGRGGDLPAVDGADGRVITLADGAGSAIVIDGVDSEPAARSLLSRAGWARSVRNLVTPTAPRWPDDEIEQLAARYRPSDTATLELVVALSGGIPLIAGCICRTVLGGTPAAWPGAVAGPAADEILQRLERKHLTSQNASALLDLAAVGEADEELLDGLTARRAEHSPFPALSRLSIITRSAHGLTIKEPYRVLLDLAHRWRRPSGRHSPGTRRISPGSCTGGRGAAALARQNAT